MKKRTYIIKIGIRLHSATTARDEACLRAQHLEAQGKDIHLWSRPYRGRPDQLIEEDFWSDGSDIPTVEPAEERRTWYVVTRDGEQYHVTRDSGEADELCKTLNADGCPSQVVETKV